MVGQQFIALLANHPWFKVEWLGASERSAGKAFRDAAAWRLPSRCRTTSRDRRSSKRRRPARAPKLVFSGLDSSVAGEIEGAFAQAGHIVVSNSRNYRMEPTVPLLIPEVNADHLALLDAQARRSGWKGRIVTNPNCAVVVLAMALAPLRQFGLKTTMITTLQAISGAGYPGVPSWDILGNVIPYIGGGEEEKIETETQQDSRRRSSGGARREPSGDGQRDDDARAGAERPHRVDCRSALEQRPTPEAIIDAWNVVPRPAAGAGAAVGAAAADRVSHRGEPSAAAARRQPRRRHDGDRRPPAPVPGASTTSSWRSATTRSAAPPARRFSTPS